MRKTGGLADENKKTVLPEGGRMERSPSRLKSHGSKRWNRKGSPNYEIDTIRMPAEGTKGMKGDRERHHCRGTAGERINYCFSLL